MTSNKGPQLTARAEISLAAVNNGWKRLAASPASTGGTQITFVAYEKNIRNSLGRDIINIYVHYEKDGSISRAIINHKYDTIYMDRTSLKKRIIVLSWLTAQQLWQGKKPDQITEGRYDS